VGARAGRPQARPGHQHRRQPRAHAGRARAARRLGGCSRCPGVFVLGSNDYFAPNLRNPLRTCCPTTASATTTGRSCRGRPGRRLHRRRLADLTNATAWLTVGGTRFAFAGVDDPHLQYDDLAAVAGPAPRRRRAAGRRPRAVPAGARPVRRRRLRRDHRRPHPRRPGLPAGVGALTTNCDLEPARAKGLHRHPADSRTGDPGSSWLHVSAGLGTNPYARIRVACRPEATLLTLPEPATGSGMLQPAHAPYRFGSALRSGRRAGSLARQISAPDRKYRSRENPEKRPCLTKCLPHIADLAEQVVHVSMTGRSSSGCGAAW
jgi:hypothetical protein